MSSTAVKALCASGAVLIALVALGGSGDDELSAGEWVNGADTICTKGTEEVDALPLITDVDSILADAALRAEIIAAVRDELIALGRPDEVDDAALDNYLAQLEGDVEVMEMLEAAVRSGDDYARLDESAGLAAADISLARCLAFSDAVVQLPY